MKKSGIPPGFLSALFIAAGLLFLTQFLHSQVNQSEFDNLGPVEFINYEGPYSIFETRAQIRAIGYSMGLEARAGNDRAGGTGRYFVIHSVSGQDGLKLDADIFGLGIDVGVDHIRNLRFIIQGYLEAAYEYTERDAFLLAEYITVYNAVYRGDLDYFNSRYKNAVAENLTRDKAGLSLRYDEWPGQALIVIPLGTGLGGPLSSIDTSTISDSRVTEQLRQEPDMSIDQRRDMVDLREREAEDASQLAAVQREAAAQEEQRITEERQQAQQQQQQAQQQQQQIAQERQQPGADQQALDRQEEAAAQMSQEAQQRQAELDERQRAADEQRREAERQEAFAEQRIAEAQQERRQIAQDQQSLINQELPRAQQQGILGVSILSQESGLGSLVLLNADTGREMRRSPINTVNVRTVTRINNRIIAIAGEDRGPGAIRLVEINAATLEMVKQGDDDIAPGSLLWANGQDLYAVVNAGDSLYMAKFNTDLVMQARSLITVHPFASPLFADNYVAAQRADGSAVLLNLGDLSERR